MAETECLLILKEWTGVEDSLEESDRARNLLRRVIEKQTEMQRKKRRGGRRGDERRWAARGGMGLILKGREAVPGLDWAGQGPGLGWTWRTASNQAHSRGLGFHVDPVQRASTFTRHTRSYRSMECASQQVTGEAPCGRRLPTITSPKEQNGEPQQNLSSSLTRDIHQFCAQRIPVCWMSVAMRRMGTDGWIKALLGG
ncbi:uncharacterized protein CIMG_12708 [Coccidioides immitis RS]|uniref:Uncharacterized protein n=1 Tax=Coccidioides immitis (strain RS) TaxID=246410 RepID=A0A0D8JRX9_COCIM|nr:uncharacterized protein CIMG_12708 [Coccidioides immitis RS]KJF60047.1 hypothetical protein CIMG_12708 [Coccidioides immitis RS]